MKTLALGAAVTLSFVSSAAALDVPLPTGWRNIEGVRQGPEGSYAVFGPFSAPTLDQAVSQRIARLTELGTKMNEKKREHIRTASGVAGLKILFEVNRDDHIYLSPHYFFMTGANEYFVIKSIPKAAEFSGNAKVIEDHIIKKIEPAG
jgi:hypothetical protein